MIETPDFTRYLSMNREQLIASLANVVHDVCILIHETSVAEAQETFERVDGYQNSRETSQKGREWDAMVRSGAVKQSLIEKKADLAIKNEEKWFLLRMLNGDSS